MEAGTMYQETATSQAQMHHNEVMSIYDLPALIKSMKRSSAWTQNGLNSEILHNKQDKQIVLIALDEDTEILFSKSEDAISFHVLEGELLVNANEESVYLASGQFLTSHKNTEYCVATTEETVFLLTMIR